VKAAGSTGGVGSSVGSDSAGQDAEGGSRQRPEVHDPGPGARIVDPRSCLVFIGKPMSGGHDPQVSAMWAVLSLYPGEKADLWPTMPAEPSASPNPLLG